MSSHDTKYQQDKWSSRYKSLTRVALMYLPLLTIVTTDISILSLLQLEFEKNKDIINNKILNSDNESNFDLNASNGMKK